MSETINHIVIVGGGTAGWITACVLAADHPSREISLIESPDIPTIGVGEGTWPSMRGTLQRIGISEAEMLSACDASFKQGTKFVGWGTNDPNDYYYHPFSLPTDYASLNLAGGWLDSDGSRPFAAFVSPQAAVIEAGLAPKQPQTPDYAFNVNYGYHFDAGKFADLLYRHATQRLGVHYISANVTQVIGDPEEDIESILLDTGHQVSGDLFVDCTGQRALLIADHYGIPFESVRHVLFNDRAIATQVPYASSTDPINSTTHATATTCGWIWDIGLQSRRGIGHVFSSDYASEAEAESHLINYIIEHLPKTDLSMLSLRTLKFDPGHRELFWHRNCVAVGLSAGFVEPLEASAIALIEQSAGLISAQFPASRDIMDVVARRFNDKMSYHWEKIIEFLKLHYAVSRRVDSPYWIDCQDEFGWPDDLRDKLMLWDQQPPWHDDAPRVDELFPSASYQYVLYGMGFRPALMMERLSQQPDSDRVQRVLDSNQKRERELLQHLLPNRQVLASLGNQQSVQGN